MLDYRSRDQCCVTRMLKDLAIPLLQDKRKANRLVFFYKVVGGRCQLCHVMNIQPKSAMNARSNPNNLLTASHPILLLPISTDAVIRRIIVLVRGWCRNNQQEGDGSGSVLVSRMRNCLIITPPIVVNALYLYSVAQNYSRIHPSPKLS